MVEISPKLNKKMNSGKRMAKERCSGCRDDMPNQEAHYGGCMCDPADTYDGIGKGSHDDSDPGVPGAPLSITIPEVRPHDDALTTYVNGRVRDALAETYAAFTIERRQWVAERAQWRRELISENVLLEAVLRKYNISLADAKAALAEYNMVGPQ